MGIILLCMVFNIINSFKTHDVEKTWLTPTLWQDLYFMAPQFSASDSLYPGMQFQVVQSFAIMFGLPLLLIFFKEPLTNLVEKRPRLCQKKKACLSYRVFLNCSKSELLFQYTLLRAYRCFCSQPRNYDGGCTYACWAQETAVRTGSSSFSETCSYALWRA